MLEEVIHDGILLLELVQEEGLPGVHIPVLLVYGHVLGLLQGLLHLTHRRLQLHQRGTRYVPLHTGNTGGRGGGGQVEQSRKGNSLHIDVDPAIQFS